MTARTQGRAHWFIPELKDRIAEIICNAALVSDTWPLAFTIMNNHLHIVARQGEAPLSWFMQRILQQTAAVVKQTHQVHDHVFGRRYWAGYCDSPSYARQVIVYTHLNAFYAGYCTHPSEYRWSTHGAFSRSSECLWHTGGFCTSGLGLFGGESDGKTETQDNYDKCIAYWMNKERLPIGVKYVFRDEGERVAHPSTHNGDVHWQLEYSGSSQIQSPSEPRVPLYDCAKVLLAKIAPNVTMDQIRSAGRIRRLVAFRRELIGALLARKYRNGAIARCLNASPSHVSDVAAEIRTAYMSI
ncbi:MAG TPA: transposase [Longimicrobiales bacterium]|nr:transposase [Longimicrobiales bacterium]